MEQERASTTGMIYWTEAGNIIKKQLSVGEKLKLYSGVWVAIIENMPSQGKSHLYSETTESGGTWHNLD